MEFPSVESEPQNSKCFSSSLPYSCFFFSSGVCVRRQKSGDTIYWHTVEESFSYLFHPSVRERGEASVTLCQRRRSWSDISRPMIGAVVTPVRSFCPRSCVHRVVSRQSLAAVPPPAHWPKRVLSACPRLALEMPRQRRRGREGKGRRVPVVAYSGLARGITAGR